MKFWRETLNIVYRQTLQVGRKNWEVNIIMFVVSQISCVKYVKYKLILTLKTTLQYLIIVTFLRGCNELEMKNFGRIL